MGEPTDSGGNEESRGTVFGVDGVSKTGSTAQDKAIGFTDGQGGKGANFDALQNATRSETSAAVAAANAARAAGGDEAAQQSAVANIFAPAAGSTLAQVDAVTQPTMSPEEFRAAEVAGVRAPPAMGQDMRLMTLPSPNPRDAIAEALRTSPYRGTNNTLLTNRMLSARTPQEERQSILQELRNRATLGDEGARQDLADVEAREAAPLAAGAGRVDLTAPNPFAAPARQALVPVGIQSLPQAATAGAVLEGDSDLAQMNRRLAREGAAGPPQFIETSRSPVRTISPNPLVDRGLESVSGYLDYPGTEQDREVYAPLIVAGTTMSPTQYADAQAFALAEPFMGMGAGDFDYGTGTTAPASDGVSRETMQPVDPAQVGGVSVPTSPPDRFKTNAQREFFENLASLPGGQAQFDAELRSLADRGFIGPRIAKVISEGGVPNYDPTAPEGYRIRGATATNFMGTMPISTYTGLDDPNAPVEVRDEQPAKAPNDPCPAGYQLIGGVCQPVDDVTQSAAPSSPGSDFQMNPTTGLPTVFQPTTVATPVDPISPFVLRQEPLLTIDPLPSPQGIQALSPTGAALGRQV